MKSKKIHLDIKPLSVNVAWQGRRFKTEQYKKYIKDVTAMLPNIRIPKEGDLRIRYEFGFVTTASDIDNPIKPIQDILQKRYNFNDSRIYELNVFKKKVGKGKEYIDIEIELI